VGTLYFAEGLPVAIVATVCAVLLKRLGVPNEKIALYAAALALPWSVRPLWSPLLEVVKTKRFFVVATELVMALALAGIAATLGLGALPLSLFLFALVAVSAATHDMAADGLYLAALTPEGQTRYVGWISVAFNLAKFVVQGVVVVVAGTLETRGGVLAGWRTAFLVLAAIAAILAVHHARVLPKDPQSRFDSLAEAAAAWPKIVATFFEREHAGRFFAFLLFYRFVEGQMVRIVPLFLIDPAARGGLELSTTEVGVFYGGLGACAFMCGSLAGAFFSRKLGLGRTLLPLCLAFHLPAVVYLLLAATYAESRLAVGSAIAIEQVAYGAGAVGLKLVMMRSLSESSFRTAHFAFATSLSGLAAAIAGMLSGSIQIALGYRAFFVWTLFASAPALLSAYVCSRKLDPLPTRLGTITATKIATMTSSDASGGT
jgi:PAT family beta-lactamase induction signal transducer AmpG